MTLFSRCDASQRFEAGHPSPPIRRARLPSEDARALAALAGFAEDVGILFRYAVGLDYYGRNKLIPKTGTAGTPARRGPRPLI